MTTGRMERITTSGLTKPMEEMLTPDFAVPKAAPKLAKAMAEVTPMKPEKNEEGSQGRAGAILG